jgi:hypothetical protein
MGIVGLSSNSPRAWPISSTNIFYNFTLPMYYNSNYYIISYEELA